VGPQAHERERFIEMLSASLSGVLSASGLRAVVRERASLGFSPWRVLEVCMTGTDATPAVEPPMEAFLEEADANGASLVVVRASKTTWFVGLLERYALWTPTRARLLANDLLAERSSP
jgi:hypothetical protein